MRRACLATFIFGEGLFIGDAPEMKATLILSFILLLAPLAPSAALYPCNAPMIRSFEGASLNWSGYAVSIPDVTYVTATFNVPTVSGPASVEGLPTDVSVWVGIDGYTSGTVEQVGVSGSFDASTNTAIYYAWWEMYPRVSTTIRTLAISAGDQITASVSYLGGGSFHLSISDDTNGQSFTTTARAPVGGPDSPQRSSAEWVVERAATIYKGYLTILPLATFSDVTFTSASFKAGGESFTLQYAVDHFTQYGGYPNSPPSQPYWEQIYIVGYDSTTGHYDLPLDTVSAVTSNSFTISFLANGEPIPIPGILRH